MDNVQLSTLQSRSMSPGLDTVDGRDEQERLHDAPGYTEEDDDEIDDFIRGECVRVVMD
jgi:hypothetical protein